MAEAVAISWGQVLPRSHQVTEPRGTPWPPGPMQEAPSVATRVWSASGRTFAGARGA